MNHRIGGHFNECLITYLLALASPTHPIPVSALQPTAGSAGTPGSYVNGNAYFGIRQPVGWPMGGPLFFTHYSFLGFDPRPWSDPWCNYLRTTVPSRAFTMPTPSPIRGNTPATATPCGD